MAENTTTAKSVSDGNQTDCGTHVVGSRNPSTASLETDARIGSHLD